MTKQLLIFYIFLSLLLFTNSAFSQQTNSLDNYSTYLPEVRAFNQQLAHMLIPPPDSNAKTQIKPVIKYIDGPIDKLLFRVFKPNTIRAIVLDIHGGGWCAGMAAFDDTFNDEMARECKVAVVSVDYHLAPPLSACIND